MPARPERAAGVRFTIVPPRLLAAAEGQLPLPSADLDMVSEHGDGTMSHIVVSSGSGSNEARYTHLTAWVVEEEDQTLSISAVMPRAPAMTY